MARQDAIVARCYADLSSHPGLTAECYFRRWRRYLAMLACHGHEPANNNQTSCRLASRQPEVSNNNRCLPRSILSIIIHKLYKRVETSLGRSRLQLLPRSRSNDRQPRDCCLVQPLSPHPRSVNLRARRYTGAHFPFFHPRAPTFDSTERTPRRRDGMIGYASLYRDERQTSSKAHGKYDTACRTASSIPAVRKQIGKVNLTALKPQATNGKPQVSSLLFR